MKNLGFRFSVLFIAMLSLDANATVLIKNGVQPNTTSIIYTVPAGKTFTLQSATFSQGQCVMGATAVDTAVHRQKILKSNIAITSDITVPAGASFQLVFNPPIVYTAGQKVSVQNGNVDNSISCTSNFLLQGK